ncbi:MAG TPA: multiheme c-type cytochrome, partial [Flavobacteriales bacterium]|nr:multiheme c-type cytochrome [Flavobacteriales bacterium]
MVSRRQRVGVWVGLLCTGLLVVAWDDAARPVVGPHSSLELRMFRSGDSLPVVFNGYFFTSGRCAGCHGHDPNAFASIDHLGRDVNLVNDWRSSMMANAARDPFFKAKGRNESLVNPAHADSLQNKCLGCHAPLGMHEERLLGNPLFTLAHLDTSRLGLDGVSCLSCHGQR